MVFSKTSADQPNIRISFLFIPVCNCINWKTPPSSILCAKTMIIPPQVHTRVYLFWGLSAHWGLPVFWGLSARWGLPVHWGLSAHCGLPVHWGLSAHWGLPVYWGLSTHWGLPVFWGLSVHWGLPVYRWYLSAATVKGRGRISDNS